MAHLIDAEFATFDVADINGAFLWPGPRLAAACERHGVPVIISPRGMLMPELIAGKSTFVKRAWIASKERPRLAKNATINVTSEEEHDGVRRMGLGLAPVAVLGNSVDAPIELPSSTEIERIWSGVAPGSRVAALKAQARSVAEGNFSYTGFVAKHQVLLDRLLTRDAGNLVSIG